MNGLILEWAKEENQKNIYVFTNVVFECGGADNSQEGATLDKKKYNGALLKFSNSMSQENIKCKY